MSDPTFIDVRGAREHNLCEVDLQIPRGQLVVFTGVSGSGKSSIAFDTIYKEGQRRFMESLSSYARQFLGQMERPDVDSVEGLSPTICIDQKTVNRNPRSTVGTSTEIYDHLRLLMARLGTPRCPICAAEVKSLSVDAVLGRLLKESSGERVQVLSPVVVERKGEYRRELLQWQADGWTRARVDGELRRLDEAITLARYEKHTIELVVDRTVIDATRSGRLFEALESAVALSGGLVTLLFDVSEQTLSLDRSCHAHPEISIPELEPRLFSFNGPQGACPRCEGLGELVTFEEAALFDESLPPLAGFRAFNANGKLPFAQFDRSVMSQILDLLGVSESLPLTDWPKATRARLLYGDPEISYQVEIARGARREVRERTWRGLVHLVKMVWKFTKLPSLSVFRVSQRCPDCEGQRLNPIARAVSFRGQSITALSRMTVGQSRDFFAQLQLDERERRVGELLIAELRDRLEFLDKVGLSYLGLDRSAVTLSGGEAQRIRLASQVGSSLQGVTYVLDEPSIGLHPRDNQRLIETLWALRDRGNSVIVVEHDEETLLAADYVVEIGPGAGRAGGRVVASGTPAEFCQSEALTARYLRGELGLQPRTELRAGTGQVLRIVGATRNNLKGIDVSFALGTFIVVTGVSGSGKSTLVFQILEPALAGRSPDGFTRLEGADQIDQVIRISQSPIGRTPRSNPVTYTKAFDAIRDLFARTPEAQVRGYKKGRFSFNVVGGRCEACQGAGVKTVEMQFLPSVIVPCELCAGARFNAETLEVRYKGKSIADVLAMTVAEAAEFFEMIPKIARILNALLDVGLDYLSIGQPSSTLSGGEAQRIKLAAALRRPATGQTLFLLDEPTTGLHAADVARLVEALHRLVDAGNTVIVVEHHLDLMRAADCLIDLGPEGGAGGGQLVGCGSPKEIARLNTPTGRALAHSVVLPVALVASAQAPYSFVDRDLHITGARQNTLQSINVRIPHSKMTVITGRSGSGKSSLAFDTIFSEGQRRYVEGLSTYARRFLGRLDRPPVDRIEGLAPAIAINQSQPSKNPRSTVATVTEIHDVLRVLFARLGRPHCPTCEVELVAYTPNSAASALKKLEVGSGWLVAPLRADQNAELRRDQLLREGWTRLYREGEECLLDDPDALRWLSEGADLVIDRLSARAARSRVSDAFAQAFELGRGACRFIDRSARSVLHFSTAARCEVHDCGLDGALTPKHFSFNARMGACEACEGLGVRRVIQPEQIVTGEGTIWEALHPKVASAFGRSARKKAWVEAVLSAMDCPKRVSDWTLSERSAFLSGAELTVSVRWTQKWGSASRTLSEDHGWPGLLAILNDWSLDFSALARESACASCGGARLNAMSRSVQVLGQTLVSLTSASVVDARSLVQSWTFSGEAAVIAQRPVLELMRRLRFLVDVGLGYLSLDRAARTLSGGEAQRIRLASQLGGGLTGLIYVLDEPTIGLHPRDTERLLTSLEGLRDQGNTVVIVEHDLETIRRADHVIDLGPGAGIEGGHVVGAGSPEALSGMSESCTGPWLSGLRAFSVPAKRREERGHWTVHSPRLNNLKGEVIRLPVGLWVGVTGVSGSGKSSLILNTFAPLLRGESLVHAGSLEGDVVVDAVVVVDQSPIGRTPRSTPATYTKIMDALRKVFASTREAKERGYKAGRFSFNAADGRCAECQGRGAILVEMHFLPDVWTVCGACRGQRYNSQTLAIKWREHSIADVLSLRIDEVLVLFSHHLRLAKKLQALVDVGLGYLSLGQPATTLSGGEAQRVKLAAELSARRGHAVYVLDEPTTGLHMEDIRLLVQVLHRLVDAGHSVFTIEHHVSLIQQCDYVVDMGPEGGEAGGYLVASGTPERVAKSGTATGLALQRMVTGPSDQ